MHDEIHATLASPHRLPDDNARDATAIQRLAGQVSQLTANVVVLTGHVEMLQQYLPRRGVERWLLAIMILLLALILGAMVGLVWEAHRIVAALPG